jgi:hypothetical protein
VYKCVWTREREEKRKRGEYMCVCAFESAYANLCGLVVLLADLRQQTARACVCVCVSIGGRLRVSVYQLGVKK